MKGQGLDHPSLVRMVTLWAFLCAWKHMGEVKEGLQGEGDMKQGLRRCAKGQRG